MKKSTNSANLTTDIKSPANANEMIVAVPAKPWITWEVEFSKELTEQDILNERPAIEAFLNKYLAQQTETKTKIVSGVFRYVWKSVSNVSNNSLNHVLKITTPVAQLPSQNFSVYKIDIFTTLAPTKSLSAPRAPGTIIRSLAGKYVRGVPSGSSKSTVRLTQPPV